MDEAAAPSRKRTGRRRKEQGERRNRLVQFRMTDEEAVDLEARAAQAGMTPGTFARAAPDPALTSQVRRLGITADQSLKAMRGGYHSAELEQAATEAYREAAALLRRLYHAPKC